MGRKPKVKPGPLTLKDQAEALMKDRLHDAKTLDRKVRTSYRTSEDRRRCAHPHLNKLYAEDPKLQRFKAEIEKLESQINQKRQLRDAADQQATAFYQQLKLAYDRAKKHRIAIENMRSRLSQYRTMTAKRRTSIANTVAKKRANDIRKELGLKPL